MAAEKKRGCGYRKIGGIYLCSDGVGEPCHRLPVPLDVCPTCHHGVKQTRGWTWLDWIAFSGGNCGGGLNPAYVLGAPHCARCVVCTPELLGLAPDKNGNTSPELYRKVGLIWIGEKFYKTPNDFTREAVEQGISRRITAIPKGFKVGEHFILVAHPRAIENRTPGAENNVFTAGIFHAFKPSRIEKILGDDASPEEVKEWEDRGCTVVKLPHDDKDHQGTVYDKDDDEEFAEEYQPKTGEKCHCKKGVERDNCADCEGTGWKIDFKAIRARAN